MGEVFRHMGRRLCVAISLYGSGNPHRCLAAQTDFYKLRLVCRKFNSVFKDQQDLTGGVVLPTDLGSQALPGLVLWLRRTAASVQHFAAYYGTPCLEVALGGLLTARPAFNTVHLKYAAASAIDLLSSTSLTCCELAAPANELNLDATGALLNLNKLKLSKGDFPAAQLPHHLIRLSLDQPSLYVWNDCICVTSLTRLKLVGSSVSGLNVNGLLACSQLQKLACCNSKVGADFSTQHLQTSRDRDLVVPTAPSTSMALTKLGLGLAGDHEYEFEVASLYDLTTLGELQLSSKAPHLLFTLDLTDLRCISALSLSADLVAEIRLSDFDCRCFPGLQLLHLGSEKFSCGLSMTSLTKLRTLSFQFESLRGLTTHTHSGPQAQEPNPRPSQ